MKKILVVFMFGMLWQTGCTDKNILWIAPGHEYKVPKLLVKDQNGDMVDILPILFPFAEQVTFTKFGPLGLRGGGVLKVTKSEYYTQQYVAEGVVYDYGCQCYYYDWYTYQVSWTDTKINEYTFKWDKESQRKISLEFSPYARIIQGTSTSSFWKLLDRDFVVYADSKKPGNVYPDVVVLQSDGVEMILNW